MNTIRPWQPWIYAAGSLVSRGGRVWQARRATDMGEVPGKSDAWAEQRPTADVKDLAAAFGSVVQRADLAGALDPRIGSGM